MAKDKKIAKERTIEEIVADTILQGNMTGKVITIDGKDYRITDPTPATLMMVSAEVSKMPHIDMHPDNILLEVLRTAKNAKPIGRIAAIMILGAKRIMEHNKVTLCKQTKRWSWRHFRYVHEWTESNSVNELDYLTKVILTSITIQTLSDFITERLKELQIGAFFGLTTTLSEVNILKPTKVVETAHGE